MSLFLRSIFSFFLIIAIAFKGITQQLIFKTYGMNDGLVHNAVRKIYQDSKGFLWIGTWEGLSKYDGHRFTNYSTADGLSNDLVNDIIEAEKHTVYFTCNDGGIHSINENGLLKKINASNTVVNHVAAIAGNKMLALTDLNGIYEFKEGKLLKPSQSGGANSYYNLIPFNDSLFFAQSDYSIQLLDKSYHLFGQLKNDKALYSECGILKDSKNRIWVGTGEGLKLLDKVQERGKPITFAELPPAFHHPYLQQKWIRAIMEDKEGNIWFGTSHGLVKVGTDGLAQLITEKNGLPANDITCIYQDREKNVWIGSSRGVARLATATEIRLFKTEDGLSSNSVFHLLPFTNGDILVVSDSTKQIYNKSTGRFSPAANEKYEAAGKSLFSPNNAKPIYSYLIYQDKKTHSTFFSPTPIGGYYAYKDEAGNYFSHNKHGVALSKDLINWKSYFKTGDTRVILLDSHGYIWAGTERTGLFRIKYNYQNGLPVLREQKHFLKNIGIRSLYQDSKGNIWAGSRYHGIFCLSRDGDILKHFTQKEGLTSNRITSIAEDKHGAIWISFYSGIDKLVPENNTYRVFNFSRFHNFFTNVQAMVFDNEHSLWLATMQGLVNIRDGETEKTAPVKTMITSAILGDSVYHNSAGIKNLSYLHNNVHFEYAAPSFINEKQMVYSYRLLGSQNTEWSLPMNEHSVSFANLRPGDYQFEVRALGWNNQWSESSSFTFSIKPPFWLRAWFIILVALLLGGLIFFSVRRRIKNIRTKAELKHKLSKAEMTALRSQMNPHFIFNCLNAIDNLIQTNQQDMATTYLARFAKLMRSVLESSKNNLVPFEKDFETLGLFLQLEQFRCSDKFTYELKADEELLHGDYKVPPLIVQPFVENAIHHGLLNKQHGEKKLLIKASLKQNRIQYTITDNGVGRIRANEIKVLNKPEHSSYGIQITAERIHLHNQNGKANDLQITDLTENGQPCGTRVEVQIKTDQ